MAKNGTVVKNPDATNDGASKIQAIKELIFGENIQEYNSEFQAVKDDILQKKNELEDLIELTRKELEQAIDTLATDLNIRITDLEDAMNEKVETLETKKVDRKQLGKLLIGLGEKIAQ